MKNLIILLLSAFLGGCTPLLIGAGLGTIAGYCVSSDTIQGELKTDFETLYSAAKDVLSQIGEIEEEDIQSGRIIAKVGLNRVKVSIDALNNNTLKLRVKCRRALLPNLSLANRIFVKIINKIK